MLAKGGSREWPRALRRPTRDPCCEARRFSIHAGDWISLGRFREPPVANKQTCYATKRLPSRRAGYPRGLLSNPLFVGSSLISEKILEDLPAFLFADTCGNEATMIQLRHLQKINHAAGSASFRIRATEDHPA
jgi:hypothetical protein